MKKITSILLTFVLALTVGSTAFASEQNTPQKSDMTVQELNTLREAEIITNEINQTDTLEQTLNTLDIAETMTPESLDTLSKVAYIDKSCETKDNIEITNYTFTPKEPTAIKNFRSGRSEESYHKVTYTYVKSSLQTAGNIEESTDISLKSEIYYSTYEVYPFQNAGKLEKAEGTILKFNENGLQNFGIYLYCTGEQLKGPGDTGTGRLDYETYERAMVSTPKVGTVYTATPNFKYYYFIDSMGILKADVYVDYRHGLTNWYSVASTTMVGKYPIITD